MDDLPFHQLDDLPFHQLAAPAVALPSTPAQACELDPIFHYELDRNKLNDRVQDEARRVGAELEDGIARVETDLDGLEALAAATAAKIQEKRAVRQALLDGRAHFGGAPP